MKGETMTRFCLWCDSEYDIDDPEAVDECCCLVCAEEFERLQDRVENPDEYECQ